MQVLEGQGIGYFIPANEVLFVCSPIEWWEVSRLEELELTVCLKDLIISKHRHVLDSQVVKRNRVIVNADVDQEVLEVSERSVVHVLKHTMLNVRVVFCSVESCIILYKLFPKQMLVTQHVSDLVRVYSLALLVSPLQSLLRMPVPILHLKVFLLRENRQFLLERVRGHLAEESLRGGVLVLELVDESFHFYGSETCQKRHEILEFLLLLLVLLVFRVRAVVDLANELKEFVTLRVSVLEQVLVDELFVVKLCDFLLGVNVEAIEFVPLIACNLLEQFPLGLTLFGDWFFRPLRHEEGKRQHLFAISIVHANLVNASFPLVQQF